MGIFPAVEDRPASYELKFYAGGRTDPVFDKVIYQQVEIVRNQLIELITDFSTGEMHLTRPDGYEMGRLYRWRRN